jgi:hypothetical protein
VGLRRLSGLYVHGFAASVDYYEIDIKGAIASLGTQLNVDRCYQGVTQLCAFITRDANGNIISVNNQPANILSQKASGIDTEASYLGETGEVYFVAENLLDRDPPLIAGSLSSGFYQGQANARFYDRLGRMLRLGARFKFQGERCIHFCLGNQQVHSRGPAYTRHSYRGAEAAQRGYAGHEDSVDLQGNCVEVEGG